ncbi:hypothetical protein NKJ23_30065 [Mesorhizobium sp. M0184]|uniref:hypothetical protein n=1 Tax=Mesorhizobium sp. M0184 TaxID=2956906 RepID=UPI00333DDFA3
MSESLPADASATDLQTLFKKTVHGRYGVRLAFRDKQRANDAADRMSPSYVLHGPKDDLHLVYLVAGEEGPRLDTLVGKWQKLETADAFVEFDVIEPDDEEFRLDEEDAAHLVAGGDFEPVTVDKIEEKLFPAGEDELESRADDTHTDTVTTSIEDAIAAGKPFFDAKITGEFVPGVLEHHFVGSKLHSQTDWKAENVFADVRSLYRHVAEHKVSDDKKGPGITACHLAKDKETGKPRRKKRNVEKNGAFMFDFDGGQTTDEILGRFEALNATFGAYSSYNHLKTEGVHKLRVILPFEKPFVPDQYGDRENRAAAVWRSSLDAFCEKHGLELDRNARDVTRFMNSPRHPEGGTYFSRLHLGPLYKIEVALPEDRPIAKLAKKGGVTLAYDSNGEAYVAEGNGVEFFLSLIGDGPDQLGFHDPIYRVPCSYFSPSNEGPDAEAGPIVQWLRSAIEKAVKGQGRAQSEIDRYVSDEYLSAEVENARKFIRDRVAAKEAEEKDDKEQMDALVADYRKVAEPKKLEAICEELADIGRASLTMHVRGKLTEKGVGKISAAAFDNVMKPVEAGAKTKRREKAKEKRKQSSGKKPIIYRSDDFDVQCQAVEAGLKLANEGEPNLFDTDGVPKRLKKGSDGNLTLEELSFTKFKNAMNESTICIDEGGDDDKKKPRKASLPDDVCSHIFGAAEFPYLLPLDRIVRTPMHSRNGSLRQENGYDHETGLYIHLGDLVVPDVRDVPTDEDMTKALDLLLGNVLYDFPFSDAFGREMVDDKENPIEDDGKGSRANALAAILQPFIRGLYNGATPAYLVDKPAQGTGSGYAVDTVSVISTGRRASPFVIPDQEDEMEKRIVSVLIEGRPIFLLDNVKGKISSPSLSSFITAGDAFSGRRLGRSEILELKIRCMVIVTGNGLELGKDERRRFVPIFMDAGVAYPEDRDAKQFKQPELHRYMLENRGDLVWSCLTIVQNWFAKGQPPGSVSMATFEDYCRVMGGILEAAGSTGFLSNLKRFRDSQTDSDSTDDAPEFMQKLFDEASKRKLLETGFTGDVAYGIGCPGDQPQFGCFKISALTTDKERALKKWLSNGTTLKTYCLKVEGAEKMMRFVKAKSEPTTKRARWKFIPVE